MLLCNSTHTTTYVVFSAFLLCFSKCSLPDSGDYTFHLKYEFANAVFCSASPANFCSTQKRHPQIWNLFSGDNGEKLVWWQVSCSSLLEERHSFLMLFCSSMFAMFVKYFCITVSMHFVKEVRHVKHCAVKASEVQVLYLF